jgi:hypothetical protein
MQQYTPIGPALPVAGGLTKPGHITALIYCGTISDRNCGLSSETIANLARPAAPLVEASSAMPEDDVAMFAKIARAVSLVSY